MPQMQMPIVFVLHISCSYDVSKWGVFTCAGSLGLGGLDFILNSAIDETVSDIGAISPSVQWQWLLGRLHIIDRILNEYVAHFKAETRLNQPPSNGAKEPPETDRPDSRELCESGPRQSCDDTCEESGPEAVVTTEPGANYSRSMSVLQFAAHHMSFPHAKVAKMTHRVFYLAARQQVQVGGMALVDQVCDLLNAVEYRLQQHMRYKLEILAFDYRRYSTRHHDDTSVMFFVTPKLPGFQSLSVENIRALSTSAENIPAAATSSAKTMVDACVGTSPLLARNYFGAFNDEDECSCSTGQHNGVDGFYKRAASSRQISSSVNDSCDLSLSTSASDTERVSFKKEVAQSSPQHTHYTSNNDILIT